MLTLVTRAKEAIQRALTLLGRNLAGAGAATSVPTCMGDPSGAPHILGAVLSGQIYLRARHDDVELVSCASPRPFGAAIFYWRYLAPYPAGHPREGQSTTELVQAIRAAKLPYVIDPGTAALTKADIATVKEGWRLRESTMAAAVDLPLRPDALLNRRRRDRFIDATMAIQSGAAAVAAPYLEYKRRGDEVLRMNLAMLRRCVAVAAGQLPVAFVQVTAAELRHGRVLQLASGYAATGVTRAFLRVRGLDAEKASADEFGPLLDAVSAFAQLGVDLVPDCVGRLGPPLVAGGASSFSSGPVNFRNVPSALLNKSGGGGVSVAYEVPGGFCAIARGARHLATPCSVQGCRATRSDATLEDLRIHNIHVLREESRLAATNGAAWYAARLIESGQVDAVVWGNVLRERAARAA